MADGRIIIDTQLDTSNVDKGVGEIKKKVGGIDFKQVGSSLTQSVTLPLAAAGGVAVKMAADASSAQGRLQAQLGLTKQEAEALKGTATDVFTNGWGESMQDVTDAIAKVKTNMGDLDGAELQGVTEGALMLRDVFEADVGESTRAAAALMKNFGIDGTQALDMITAGFQKGGDYSGEFIDVISEYSTQFANMGFSAESMFDILITGAENGAWNMDKVGDAVKEFHIRAQDGSDATADGFAAIGLDAADMGAKIAAGGEEGEKAFMATVAALAAMEDPVARNQAGVALFGTQWEDLNEKVVTSLADSKGALGDFEGATAEAGNAVSENIGTQFTTAMRQLGDALIPIGEILISVISGALPHIQKLAAWLGKLSPTTQTIIVVLAALAAAVGPVLVVIGMLAPVITGAATALGIGAAALLGWVAVIAVVIAAVVAIGIAIYKNWDTIKAKTIEFMTTVKSYFMTGWQAISAYVVNLMATLKSYFITGWNAIKAAVVSAITATKNFIISAWNAIKAYFIFVLAVYRAIFTAAWNGIKNAITTVMNAIRTTITTVWNGIKSAITTVMNAIKAVIMAIWNGIRTYYTTLFRTLSTIVRTGMNGMRTAILTVMNAIRSVITNTWNGIKSVITRVVNGIRTAAVSAFNAMKSGISNSINAISSIASSVFNRVKSAIINPIQSAKDKVIGIIGAIKGAFSKMSITIPKPKLPRVSVSMGSKSVGGIDIPFPKFSVDWYAKGGVFNGASVIGVGEQPGVKEAVVPLSGRNMQPFAEAIAKMMPQQSGGGGVPQTINNTFMVDGKQIATQLVPTINTIQERQRNIKSFSRGVR